MTALILIIKAFLLGWLLANFEPLQEALKPLKAKTSDKYFSVFYLKTAVSCHKCLAFYSGLILSGSIFIAAGAALAAYLYERHIS